MLDILLCLENLDEKVAAVSGMIVAAKSSITALVRNVAMNDL